MSQPAAPFHEHGVAAEVQAICDEHGLFCDADATGNLIVRLTKACKARPLVLAAHMDHPGFEFIRRRDAQTWIARFLGGVPESYFRKGIPLRVMPQGAPARLGRRVPGKVKYFEILLRKPLIDKPGFAVWDLPAYRAQRDRISGRACDDLIGVAAVLATLIRLKRARVSTNVIGAISRAEEVGFHGALMIATSGILKRDALVISLETSRELPGVSMGRGVIVRVGDRASVFASDATRYLGEIASHLAKNRKEAFQFQRALMGGGTCEGTAYQEFGFSTAAVCVALGNYHNCAPGNRIAAEYVSIADALSMVELLTVAAKRMGSFDVLTRKLSTRLQKLLSEARLNFSRRVRKSKSGE